MIVKLYTKLMNDTYDSGEFSRPNFLKKASDSLGDFVQLLEDRNDDCYRLAAITELKKESEVLLVDHFFQFR